MNTGRISVPHYLSKNDWNVLSIQKQTTTFCEQSNLLLQGTHVELGLDYLLFPAYVVWL